MQGAQDEVDFDEDWYLAAYPDVAAALRNGHLASGLEHYRSFGRSEGRRPHGRAGRIAIITMVYNERVNLPVWLAHYRRTAPGANLFVIDHASDDGSTDDLHGVTKIPLPRDRFDEIDRVVLINSLQHGLLRYYEVVIYTDCDELLVPDPQKSASLEAHLAARRRYAYASPIGINVIHQIDVEPALDFTKPLLRQRSYGQFHSQLCKPIVTRVPMIWDPGFHISNRPISIDEDLYLFHLKQIDRDEGLRRQRLSRGLLWSRQAIDGQHSAHHRYDDDRFVREFFLDPTNQRQTQGAQRFRFDAELLRLRTEAREVSGMFRTPSFTGPIIEIPEQFRDIF
jgi:glycosyl transferase family 2